MELDASAQFDPYHKWLGIPPTEQPPHHYRLLGIAAFESDRDVIAAAADRQMAHVKSFATGRHAAASQTLLNELSKARVALLNAAQKKAYDRRLRQSLARVAGAAPTALPAARRDSTDELALRADELPSSSIRATSMSASRQFHRRRQNDVGLQWLLVAGGVGVIAAMMFYAAANRPAEPSVAASPTKPTLGDEPVPKKRKPPIASKPSPHPTPKEPNADGAPLPNDLIAAPAEVQPRAIEQPRKPPLQAPAAIAQELHEIDLDLSDRVQRLTLPAMDGSEFRVLGLRGCKSPCTVEPSDGKLSRGRDATVTVSGPRVAIWKVSINPRSSDQTLVEVEGVIVTDDDQQLPFTMANIGRVCRQLTKRYEQAAALLESGQIEQARLQSWLDAPGMKPAAEVGPARARVRALTRSIPEQSKIVQSLAADLRVAEDVKAFAEHLDRDCVIEIMEEKQPR